MQYHWYEIARDNEIQQGDILFNFDVPIVRYIEAEQLGDIETFDLIVMTQSCDIPKDRMNYLVLCPIWPLETASKLHPEFSTSKGKENLRKGSFIAFHLLNKCEMAGFEHDFMIVQFERVIERPKVSVQEFVSKQQSRLRLLPPYREHLSQAFARFFMRVGLPVDIPVFTK